MINPVTGWFEITQQHEKKEIKTSNLVETTWLNNFPWPTKITYDRGSEFLIHEFKNTLIQE